MLGKLKKLRTLTLSHNQLETLPDGFSGSEPRPLAVD